MEKTLTATLLALALLTGPALAGGLPEDVWTPSDRLVSPEIKPWSGFGKSIAEENGTAVVGAPGENAVYLFDKSGQSWVPTASLSPSASGDGFGWSVALDSDGNALAVAAPWDSTVHVYERSGSDWTLEATLKGENALGIGLALEEGTLIAGAPDSGTLRIFDDAENGWMEIASVSGDGAFGFSAALTPDAERAVVGAISDSEVHVFDATSSAYSKTDVLTSDASLFGFSVDLTPDGQTIVSGALGGDSVHVFQQDGGPWTETAEISATDVTSLGFDDGLGAAVDVSKDASKILAGTGFSGTTKPGAAFLFTNGGDGWGQSAQLLPPEPVPKANFGRTVTFASDSSEILVGAPGSGVPEASTLQPGGVYAFLNLPGSLEDVNGGTLDVSRE